MVPPKERPDYKRRLKHASESPEEQRQRHENRNQRDRDNYNMNHANESPEQRRQRLENRNQRDRDYYNMNRANESPEHPIYLAVLCLHNRKMRMYGHRHETNQDRPVRTSPCSCEMFSCSIALCGAQGSIRGLL